VATDPDDVSLEDFLANLKLDRHTDLWALVRQTIKMAESPGGLEALRKTQRVGKLRGLKESIWEFRIPPKNRKGGVVRIYFCHIKGSDYIICLSAEFKKRAGSSNQKIQSAQKRYREVCR